MKALLDRIKIYKPIKVRNTTSGEVTETLELQAVRSVTIESQGGSRQNVSDSEIDIYDAVITVRSERLLDDMLTDWVIEDYRSSKRYELVHIPLINSRTDRTELYCRYLSK